MLGDIGGSSNTPTISNQGSYFNECEDKTLESEEQEIQ
jgi:hypothetical protein